MVIKKWKNFILCRLIFIDSINFLCFFLYRLFKSIFINFKNLIFILRNISILVSTTNKFQSISKIFSYDWQFEIFYDYTS